MNRMKTKVQKKIKWEHIEDFYNSYGRNLFILFIIVKFYIEKNHN